MKRIQELTDEYINDKHRINDLLKVVDQKGLDMQVLQNKMNAFNSRNNKFKNIKSNCKD